MAKIWLNRYFIFMFEIIEWTEISQLTVTLPWEYTWGWWLVQCSKIKYGEFQILIHSLFTQFNILNMYHTVQFRLNESIQWIVRKSPRNKVHSKGESKVQLLLKKCIRHQSGTLPDFGGCSWLLGWRSGSPGGSNVISLPILIIWKIIGFYSFIQLKDMRVTVLLSRKSFLAR